MHLSVLATIALFSSLGITTPTPIAAPESTPDSLNVSVSVPENRVTTYPVCGTLGFTSEPGDNDLGIFPPPPVSLEKCICACRENSTCEAVSYAEKFQLCSFYGKPMRFDHLDEDDSSNFAHYDKVCDIEWEEEKDNEEEGDEGNEGGEEEGK